MRTKKARRASVFRHDFLDFGNPNSGKKEKQSNVPRMCFIWVADKPFLPLSRPKL
jgi:hypothetical protein